MIAPRTGGPRGAAMGRHRRPPAVRTRPGPGRRLPRRTRPGRAPGERRAARPAPPPIGEWPEGSPVAGGGRAAAGEMRGSERPPSGAVGAGRQRIHRSRPGPSRGAV